LAFYAGSRRLPRVTRSTVALLALMAAPGSLLAQGTPLGPEFRVNTYTTNSQRLPSVASDSAGNFVVVWWNFGYSTYGIFAQRYASTGAPNGAEFRVNSYTTGSQRYPSVAADSTGNFVVAWQRNSGPSIDGIFAQRYNGSGAPVGGEFRVNSYTTNPGSFPCVATDPSGNLLVAWVGVDGDNSGVFGQRFAGNGSPLGGEFRVNTFTTNIQVFPAVASDSSGRFVVVWQSYTQDGSGSGIFGQRYASTGAPLGGEFRVNNYTTLGQRYASVASDAAGNFVVVWEGAVQDGDGGGVFGQRYTSAGAPLGAEFRVNTYTTNHQGVPSVASDSAGNFVVTWQSATQDGSLEGVFAQRYGSTGVPLGGEFRVNTYTTSQQMLASVASDTVGHFVVTWSSADGSYDGVFGQRFSIIVPVELEGFRIE
jgi:hypothetical protein